jgi:cyclopropane fatty-acyl-phospholipid synthase-like methyltransferase
MNTEKVIDYYSRCHMWYKIFLGIKRNYSLHYGFYDEKNRKYDDAVRNTNRILAEIAHINPNEKVLDIGCGVGGSAVCFAKERGANVIGIDINKTHIEMAKK